MLPKYDAKDKHTNRHNKNEHQSNLSKIVSKDGGGPAIVGTSFEMSRGKSRTPKYMKVNNKGLPKVDWGNYALGLLVKVSEVVTVTSRQ